MNVDVNLNRKVGNFWLFEGLVARELRRPSDSLEEGGCNSYTSFSPEKVMVQIRALTGMFSI